MARTQMPPCRTPPPRRHVAIALAEPRCVPPHARPAATETSRAARSHPNAPALWSSTQPEAVRASAPRGVNNLAAHKTKTKPDRSNARAQPQRIHALSQMRCRLQRDVRSSSNARLSPCPISPARWPAPKCHPVEHRRHVAMSQSRSPSPGAFHPTPGPPRPKPAGRLVPTRMLRRSGVQRSRKRCARARRVASTTWLPTKQKLNRIDLTPCRSAASGEFDAHSTPTYAPLVGCSGWLGGDRPQAIRPRAPQVATVPDNEKTDRSKSYCPDADCVSEAPPPTCIEPVRILEDRHW